jgi:hypothetical protein
MAKLLLLLLLLRQVRQALATGLKMLDILAAVLATRTQ